MSATRTTMRTHSCGTHFVLARSLHDGCAFVSSRSYTFTHSEVFDMCMSRASKVQIIAFSIVNFILVPRFIR